jgi:hypothetical protein
VIDRLAHGATHQGVVADVETERSVGLRELAEARRRSSSSSTASKIRTIWAPSSARRTRQG